jgi:uncharacterized protein
MSGEPTFLELGVPSGSRARAFYEALLGWKMRDMKADNFHTQTATAGIGVHCGDPDACFVPYFAVPDIDAAIAHVTELGGKAGRRSDDSGLGRFAECTDPQGVRFGLHQAPPAT